MKSYEIRYNVIVIVISVVISIYGVVIMAIKIDSFDTCMIRDVMSTMRLENQNFPFYVDWTQRYGSKRGAVYATLIKAC